MEISKFEYVDAALVVALFKTVFSDSEGPDEGELIEHFVSELIASTATNDLVGYVAKGSAKRSAKEQGEIYGAIFFSRLTVQGEQSTFILSPVAISTKKQGQGVGQMLISHGLQDLKASGVEFVFTYGDPNYYSKLGFEALSEDVVKAPLTLSHPEGWLAQSLHGMPFETIKGESGCVPALNNQDLW